MQDILKKAVRDTLVFGLVGFALALAAPYIATGLGLDPGLLGYTANPAWLGVFFGLFGTGAALIDPLFSFAFDKNRAVADIPGNERAVSKEEGREPTNLTLNISSSPGKETVFTTVPSPSAHGLMEVTHERRLLDTPEIVTMRLH